MVRRSFTYDDRTEERIEQIAEVLRESGYEPNSSSVMRFAVYIAWRHIVSGETLVHPEDPRAGR